VSVVARAPWAAQDDVIAALRETPKRLPSRLVQLDAIASLDDYYPTRIEMRLLDDLLPAIADDMGRLARVIEPGAGAGIKTRRLLRALVEPSAYVGIDIDRDILDDTAETLARELPNIDVQTICADYTSALSLPQPRRAIGRSLAFFPGATIGNYEPFDAIQLLANLQRIVGADGRLLLGADGTQDAVAVARAYDDVDGVIAQTNLAALAQLNRMRGATFDLSTFRHRAVWNARHARVELQLVSLRGQIVDVGGAVVELGNGEPIVTQHCYKHSLQGLRGMLHAAGWDVRHVVTGKEHPMRLWWCAPLRRPVGFA
jgi:L-histidine N-alpha-methyltransferase